MTGRPRERGESEIEWQRQDDKETKRERREWDREAKTE